jgi:SET domain-containing protein
VHQPPFDIRQSQYGRGLFATQPIEQGELVHVAPVIPLTAIEKESVNKTILKEYLFWYEQGDYVLAVGLGYSSLFNHSSSPNVLFDVNFDRQEIVFTAKVRIEPDSELMIDYEYDPVFACRSQL